MQIVAQAMTLADKGPGVYLYGNYVTPEFHDEVTMLMRDNFHGSPVYEARTRAHAFFQGGHGERTGKFVFIEFWTRESHKYDRFVDMIDEAYQKVRKPELEKIIVPETIDNLELADLIAEKRKTPYECVEGQIVFTPAFSSWHRSVSEFFYSKGVLRP